jgi:hypothetical protein
VEMSVRRSRWTRGQLRLCWPGGVHAGPGRNRQPVAVLQAPQWEHRHAVDDGARKAAAAVQGGRAGHPGALARRPRRARTRVRPRPGSRPVGHGDAHSPECQPHQGHRAVDPATCSCTGRPAGNASAAARSSPGSGTRCSTRRGTSAARRARWRPCRTCRASGSTTSSGWIPTGSGP